MVLLHSWPQLTGWGKYSVTYSLCNLKKIILPHSLPLSGMFGVEELSGWVGWWLVVGQYISFGKMGGRFETIANWVQKETGSARRRGTGGCVERSWDGRDQSFLRDKDFLSSQLHFPPVPVVIIFCLRVSDVSLISNNAHCIPHQPAPCTLCRFYSIWVNLSGFLFQNPFIQKEL